MATQGQQSASTSRQMNTLQSHLTALSEASQKCMTETLSRHAMDLGAIHELDMDLASWVARITGPERELLDAGRKELALAEFCLTLGLYRQAFASLRLFLELSFAAVYFSANELERRRWKSDRQDFSWSKALDKDTGVLSSTFIQEFNLDAAPEAGAFSGHVAETYRHCSQFVHGKSVASESLPRSVTYAESVVRDWCQHASQSGQAAIFLMFARYGKDIDLGDATELQEGLIARFSHLGSVRTMLDMTRD